MDKKTETLIGEIGLLEAMITKKAQLEIQQQNEMEALNLRIINCRGRLGIICGIIKREAARD